PRFATPATVARRHILERLAMRRRGSSRAFALNFTCFSRKSIAALLVARALLFPFPLNHRPSRRLRLRVRFPSRDRVGPSHSRSTRNRRPYLTQGVCMRSKRFAFTAATAVAATLFVCADVAHAQGRGGGPGGGQMAGVRSMSGGGQMQGGC